MVLLLVPQEFAELIIFLNRECRESSASVNASPLPENKYHADIQGSERVKLSEGTAKKIARKCRIVAEI